MDMRQLGLRLGVAMAAWCCFACQSETRRPVYPVSGQVLYEGQPVAGALVALLPLDERWSERAIGRTDADGRFRLTTYLSNDGAPEGSYVVGISMAQEESGREDEDGNGRPSVIALPARYAQHRTSGLTATIRPGINELPPFHLHR